ncbi:MAG: hypothetical protein JNJ88_20180 [Planctomycetes bacterium]|nr:hypothetical protein [Planctomycetota bacterium]
MKPDNGSVDASFEFPTIPGSTIGAGLDRLEPHPSGGVVALLGGYIPVPPPALPEFPSALGWFDGSSLRAFAPHLASRLWHLRVEMAGTALAFKDPTIGTHNKLVRVDLATGSFLREWTLGEHPFNVYEFAIGPSGEEIYGLAMGGFGPQRMLIKFSLVTGQLSKIRLHNFFTSPAFGQGDPTGHTLATVVDPAGDADHDGIANATEVRFGYNPFDATSRPGGPKVYVRIERNASGQGLRLGVDLNDPDGVMHPVQGLDFSTLQILMDDPSGAEFDALPALIPLLQSVRTNTDGTMMSLGFDLSELHGAANAGFTASILDRTGARGWDWHNVPNL